MISAKCKKRILRCVKAGMSIAALAALASACATTAGAPVREWAAYGYLTPGPTSEPELIGVFTALDECREAADGWASRQVVGNPVLADCYPVDRR